MKNRVFYVSTPKFIDLVVEHINLCSNIKFILILCVDKNNNIDDQLLRYLQEKSIQLILLPIDVNKIWASIRLIFLSFIHKVNIIHLDGLSGVTSLILLLRYKKIIVSVHDVKPHTGEDVWFNVIRDRLLLIPRRIVLFSKYSLQEYHKIYGLTQKASQINLPVYTKIYDIVTKKKVNLYFEEYYIIFGRISPYKGIEKFIQEFISTNSLNKKLLIAGSPNYDFKPVYDKNIQYILKYISFQELKYLLFKCNGVIVPYLDATQSGVISTAKAFKKPIYVRKIEAFLEFKNNDFVKLYDQQFNCEILEAPMQSKKSKFNKDYSNQFTRIYKKL